MLPRARPPRPSLGKEAYALLYWLVLRTPPYELKVNILTYSNPIIHVILETTHALSLHFIPYISVCSKSTNYL